jgi:hypothetical protein
MQINTIISGNADKHNYQRQCRSTQLSELSAAMQINTIISGNADKHNYQRQCR